MLRAIAGLLLIGLGVFSAFPAQAQNAPPPAADMRNAPAPLEPGDPFGDTVEMPARTIVTMHGQGTWDKAFDIISDAFKTLNKALAEQNIQPSGPAMTIYTKTDILGFDFQAAVPIAEAPKGSLPAGVSVDQAPVGKALKFTHRGSFDALDMTYEAITNHLDEKRIEAKQVFIEEYVGGFPASPEGTTTVSVYVPVN